jgi:hypothetical protein
MAILAKQPKRQDRVAAAGKRKSGRQPTTCRDRRVERIARSARHAVCQAARIVARNLLIASSSRLLSLASERADDSTCEEAEPVSAAPRLTLVMFEATCVVPDADVARPASDQVRRLLRNTRDAPPAGGAPPAAGAIEDGTRRR